MSKSNHKSSRRKTITRHYIETLLVSMLIMMILSVMLVKKDRGAYIADVVNRESSILANSTAAYYSYLVSVMLRDDNESLEKYLNQIQIEEGLVSVAFLKAGPEIEALLNECNFYHSAGPAITGVIPGCHYVENNQVKIIQEFTSGSRTIGYLVKSRHLSLMSPVRYVLRRPLLLVWLIFVLVFGVYFMRELHVHLVRPLTFLSRNARKLVFDKMRDFKLYEVHNLANALAHAHHEIVAKSKLASIGQSSTMIAHDIRNPFSQMKSLLNMIPDKKNDSMFVNYAVSQVNDSIRRVDSMLSDVLDYSRETQLERVDVSIQGMIKSAFGVAFKNAENADIGVRYQFNHSICVNVDEIQVARVFTNIIGNAVEAMKGHGHISIESRDVVEDGNAWVEVKISNTGPRIPDDNIPHLFEPFYTKGKKEGTGLGLAICQKIVSAHGGNVEVVSTDGRTSFIITLPAGESQERIDESELIRHSREISDLMPPEPAKRSLSEDISIFLDLHKKRGEESYLLIVDDEPLFRVTVRSLISRIPEVCDNLKVVEADSAEIALKQFEARQFDYVISDIDMGRMRMDGYEFVRHILDHYPKTMTLIHSNKRIHGKDEELIGRRNFQGFLPKPMDEEELVHFLAGKVFERAEGGVSRKEQQRKKVLVINDESVMRLGIRHAIQKGGDAHVVEANGMADALKVMAEQEVDVVLADINLDRNGSGYDILKKVRSEGKKVKFYMMSGMTKEDEWPKAKELGADGYIQVPYEEGDLRNVLSGTA